MKGNAIGRARIATAFSGRTMPLPAVRQRWRARSLASGLMRDQSGIAATEFSVIVPLMLVLFFGLVELTDGIAAYRKVTISAHTISDLTSQSQSVYDADLSTFFCASAKIMYPYVSGPCPQNSVKQTVMELWVNPSLQARVQWAVNSDGSTPLSAGTVLTVPTALQVANTYVIYSSVSYLYQPTGGVGYVMNKAGVTLSDFTYTRPRQSQCVQYDTPATPTSTCPQN